MTAPSELMMVIRNIEIALGYVGEGLPKAIDGLLAMCVDIGMSWQLLYLFYIIRARTRNSHEGTIGRGGVVADGVRKRQEAIRV